MSIGWIKNEFKAAVENHKPSWQDVGDWGSGLNYLSAAFTAEQTCPTRWSGQTSGNRFCTKTKWAGHSALVWCCTIFMNFGSRSIFHLSISQGQMWCWVWLEGHSSPGFCFVGDWLTLSNAYVMGFKQALVQCKSVGCRVSVRWRMRVYWPACWKQTLFRPPYTLSAPQI